MGQHLTTVLYASVIPSYDNVKCCVAAPGAGAGTTIQKRVPQLWQR